MKIPSPLVSYLFSLVLSLLALGNAASVEKRDLVPPNDAELGNEWDYQGCYRDVGRTINAASTADAQMTNQKCMQFCFSRKFPYAGTEYASECYCGDRLAIGGIEVPASDCFMSCAGNKTQPCGGAGRLTLWKTSNVSAPSFNPGVNGWVSMGCYLEGISGHALTHAPDTIVNAEITVAKCTAACKSADAGFILAGVEYGGECCEFDESAKRQANTWWNLNRQALPVYERMYCGKELSNGARKAPDDSKCNMVCNGNSSEYCGGPGALNVYQYSGQSLP
ncbi:hypothetical protein E4U43_006823, partial [Claviceps pusilla]